MLREVRAKFEVMASAMYLAPSGSMAFLVRSREVRVLFEEREIPRRPIPFELIHLLEILRAVRVEFEESALASSMHSLALRTRVCISREESEESLIASRWRTVCRRDETTFLCGVSCLPACTPFMVEWLLSILIVSENKYRMVWYGTSAGTRYHSRLCHELNERTNEIC